MIKAVQKAIEILLYLSNTPESAIPLNTIANDLGMKKTTCAHHLKTLCESLMVEKVSRQEGYRLGPSAYILSRYGRYQEPLIELCYPLIKWLRTQVEATVFLSVVCDGVKYIVVHEDCYERLDIRQSEIIKGNIESTATGLLMMAYMDDDSLDRVFRRRAKTDSPFSEKKQEELYRLFKKIRTNNYAHIINYTEKNHSFAFRVWDGKRTVASIGILYPFSEDSTFMRNHVIQSGKTAANEASRRLMFKV